MRKEKRMEREKGKETKEVPIRQIHLKGRKEKETHFFLFYFVKEFDTSEEEEEEEEGRFTCC